MSEDTKCQHNACEHSSVGVAALVRAPGEDIRLCQSHYEQRVLPGTPDDVRVKPGLNPLP